MSSKALILSVLVTLSQARFNQEGIPGAAVAALSNRGNPGESGTLSGQVPGVLLGAANACDKLKLADEIVATLGNTQDVLDAAIGVVAAEKNFNPSAQSTPTICDDATLPVTPELRGIVPLVDPAVTGSDVENANSASSKTTPFAADGLSVVGVMAAQGFSNFTTQTADGAAGAAPAAGNNAGANNGAANKDNGNANAGADAAAPVQDCNGGAAQADNNNANADANKGNADNNNANNNANNNNNDANANQGAAAGSAATKSSIAGLDFGLCVPTMDLQAGRAGRKADELTFLPTDPLVAKGQQDALNPNIITNRICDQLTNVCEANQAAKDACDKAQTLVQGLGTKDQSTADAFNQALGFA